MTHEAKVLFAKSQNLQMKKGKRGPYKGRWGVEVPDLEDGAYRIKRCHKSGAMATKREAHDNKEQQRIALAEKRDKKKKKNPEPAPHDGEHHDDGLVRSFGAASVSGASLASSRASSRSLARSAGGVNDGINSFRPESTTGTIAYTPSGPTVSKLGSNLTTASDDDGSDEETLPLAGDKEKEEEEVGPGGPEEDDDASGSQCENPALDAAKAKLWEVARALPLSKKGKTGHRRSFGRHGIHGR